MICLLITAILFLQQKDISILLLFLSLISGIILIEQYESKQQRLLVQIETIAQASPLALTGRVVDSSIQGNSWVTVTLDEIRFAYQGTWHDFPGKILLNYSGGSTNPVYYFGDRIRSYGLLNLAPEPSNPDEFDYRHYLLQNKIYGIFYCWQTADIQAYQVQHRTIPEHMLRFASKIKHYFVTINSASLPTMHAALLNGIVLGEKSELTDDIRDAFIRCGIFHILVVSGSNVMLVAFIVYVFLKVFRVKRRIAALCSIPLIILYGMVAGYQSPVSRATIMSIMVLLGIAFKQDDQIINNIGIAALIAVLFNPADIFSASFQLSFFTILGIVLIYPILDSWYPFPKRFRFIQVLLYGTIASLIGILPLSAYYFNIISFISPITNLIAGPIVSIILPAGFVSGFIYPISPSITQLIANTNWLFLTILINSVQFLYYIPGSYIYVGKPALGLVAVYYLFLLGFIYTFYPINSAPNFRLRKKWLFATVSGILIYFFLTSFQLGNKTITMTFINVGQGDSAFIQFPNNRNLLIDGGDYSAGKRILVPYLRRLGINRIDTVILTHPHNDHVGGLVHILDNFDVGKVIDGKQAQFDPEYYPEFCSLIQQKHIEWKQANQGEYLDIFSSATVRFIHPVLKELTKNSIGEQRYSSSEINNNSIVLQLIYGRVTALFAGDIEQETEKKLVQEAIPLGAMILKVPHHGSAVSSEISFLQNVHPQVAIISVGKRNTFNLPSPRTISKLNQLQSQIYRTDEDGAVVIQSDGISVKLTKYKNHTK